MGLLEDIEGEIESLLTLKSQLEHDLANVEANLSELRDNESYLEFKLGE